MMQSSPREYSPRRANSSVEWPHRPPELPGPERRRGPKKGGESAAAVRATLVYSVAGHGEDRDDGRGEDGDGVTIPAATSSTVNIFPIVRGTQQTLLVICYLRLEQENKPVAY